MTISFSDIDQLLVLVDVDDPATYDLSFQKHLEFAEASGVRRVREKLPSVL